MPASDLIGTEFPPSAVVLERGPVANFAKAVKDDNPVYQAPGAPLPPTYPFVMSHWGAFPELQPEHDGGVHAVNAVLAELMKDGGLILHGEQEFTYHRPAAVGDTLYGTGRIADIFTKEGSGGARMTFVKAQTDYRDEAGELVITSVMTLLHRAKTT